MSDVQGARSFMSGRAEALMLMPDREAPPEVQLDALMALLVRSVDESGDYMLAMALLVGQHVELEPIMHEQLRNLGLVGAADAMSEGMRPPAARTRSLPRRRYRRR